MKQSDRESDLLNIDQKTYTKGQEQSQPDLTEEEDFYKSGLDNFGEGTFDKRAIPGTGAKRISTKKTGFVNLNVNQSKNLSHMNP